MKRTSKILVGVSSVATSFKKEPSTVGFSWFLCVVCPLNSHWSSHWALQDLCSVKSFIGQLLSINPPSSLCLQLLVLFTFTFIPPLLFASWHLPNNLSFLLCHLPKLQHWPRPVYYVIAQSESLTTHLQWTLTSLLNQIDSSGASQDRKESCVLSPTAAWRVGVLLFWQ